MKLTNERPEVIMLFEQTVKGHDEVRAHIEFAYAHYDEFMDYCKSVTQGAEPYFN